jgi:hypothetical protein
MAQAVCDPFLSYSFFPGPNDANITPGRDLFLSLANEQVAEKHNDVTP